MKFRYDINGLRAIAVFAVVLFHFLPSTLPGGFAGVDVFFVISGYLMTRIIFNGLDKDNFNLLNFYKSRIIRIIPAASILFIVLLIFGWFLLIPKEYVTLSKHVYDSSVFLSNLSYMKELGYFDIGSHEKWLLHTWSLSIEWQFYLIYPVILIATNKIFQLKAAKLTVLFMFFISLVFCIYTSRVSPEKAYFSFYARIWEMLAGGIVFLFFQRDSSSRNLSSLGLLLIIISYFAYSNKTVWPSYNAILPVLGAFLILIANNQSSIIYNNVISQSIGKWSYSIYLWHWPIAVYLHMSPYANNTIAAVFGMCVSVFLGYLSFRYIESFDFKKYKYGYSYPLLMILIIFLAGKTISHYDGYNSNYDLIHVTEEKLSYETHCHIDDKSNNRDNLNCKIGNERVIPQGILWGDSYAGHLNPFLKEILPEDTSFISRTISECFPTFDIKEMKISNELSGLCDKSREVTQQELSKGVYDIAFIAGRWDLVYTNYGNKGVESIEEAIKYASEHTKTVYVFAQPVLYKNLVMNTYLRHEVSSLFSGELVRDDSLPMQLNTEIEKYIHNAGFRNVVFVTREMLYGSEFGDDLTSENLPYTYDGGHLSEYGSKAAAKNFKDSPLYNQFIKQLAE